MAEENTPNGDDLDALLADFDNSTKQQPDEESALGAERLALESKAADLESQTADFTAQRDAFNDEVQQYTANRAAEQAAADIKTVIGKVRGDLNPEFFDDEMVAAWLDNQARKSPYLQEVWLNRGENPNMLRVAVEELGRAFHEKYSKMPDPAATADVAAVAAAVRNASSNKIQPEPPPRFGRMSNAEFRQWHLDNGLPPPF